HKTVANVALQLLQPGVADTLSAILAADGNKALPSPSIVDIATWPDDYAHSPEGKWTKHFHYIDAKDNPPFECNVDMARDCDAHGGCVVSAIANYTGQLVHPSRNVNETAQALKFVVHFLGDIAQPLHNEFIAWGGNGIMVKWEGETKRLHGGAFDSILLEVVQVAEALLDLFSVWDYSIIEKWVGPDDQHSLEWWTKAIVDEIKDGIYKDSVSGWLEHTDINDAENSALQWAIDSNKLICDYVLKTDPKGKELSGS
ncbi:hypothetical protein FRB90_012815, partial [Tulasnella sp. 427]